MPLLYLGFGRALSLTKLLPHWIYNLFKTKMKPLKPPYLDTCSSVQLKLQVVKMKNSYPAAPVRVMLDDRGLNLNALYPFNSSSSIVHIWDSRLTIVLCLSYE